jgi:GMP synthase-like glutamine amidotransferase
VSRASPAVQHTDPFTGRDLFVFFSEFHSHGHWFLDDPAAFRVTGKIQSRVVQPFNYGVTTFQFHSTMRKQASMDVKKLGDYIQIHDKCTEKYDISFLF